TTNPQAVGAERHPNSNFTRPVGHEESHHSVDSGCRDNEREHSKPGDDASREQPIGELSRVLVVDELDFEDVAGVDTSYGLIQIRSARTRIDASCDRRESLGGSTVS